MRSVQLALVLAMIPAGLTFGAETPKSCTFTPLELTNTHSQSPSGHYAISTSSSQKDGSTLEIVDTHGKGKRCKSPYAAGEGLYISSNEDYLMTVSNSVNLIRTSDCGPADGAPGRGAIIYPNRIEYSAPCLTVFGQKDMPRCSSAKVYDIQPDCRLVLNTAASNRMTQTELGVQLPLDQYCDVAHPHTPQARVGKCIPAR